MSGMWSQVICAKYLKNVNVIDWFRNPKKLTKGISNIWSSFMHSFNVLGD